MPVSGTVGNIRPRLSTDFTAISFIPGAVVLARPDGTEAIDT
jgi:hypothetical protein